MRAARFLLAILALSSATAVEALTPGARQILFGAPGWVFPGAAIDMNFATAQYFGASPSNLTVSRASAATCGDGAGNYYTFGTNLPRVCPVTGLWAEEARANGVRNNTMQGAVVGSPGTLPSDWTKNAALTLNVVGTGVEGGIPYVDIQFTGTPGSSGQSTLGFEQASANAVSPGATWTESVFIRQVGGSTANVTGEGVELVMDTSSLTFVGNCGVNFVNLSATAIGAGRSGCSVTAGATTAYIQPLIYVNFSAGAVSQTLRIGWPQLELNPNISSSIASAANNVQGAGNVCSASCVETWSGSGCTTNPAFNVTVSGGLVSYSSVKIAGACGASTLPSSSATTWALIGTGVTDGADTSFTLTPVNNAAQGFATTPIPTTGSATARAAENITLSGTSTSTPTIYARGAPEAPAAYSVSQVIASLGPGATGEQMLRAPGGNAAFQVDGSAACSPPAWPQSTSEKAALAYAGSGVQRCVVNATTGTASIAAAAPSSSIALGADPGPSAPFNGSIARFAEFSAALSLSQLQTLP